MVRKLSITLDNGEGNGIIIQTDGGKFIDFTVRYYEETKAMACGIDTKTFIAFVKTLEAMIDTK